MTPRPFRFGLSAVRPIESRRAWQELARRAEGDGWSVLLLADHLGMADTFSPLVSAADVTSTLRVGTMVVNNDFALPLRLAQEAATVDLLTDGRLELGLGSGWAKPEYDLLGISYDPPRIRTERLAEAITVMKRAWAGEITIPGARNDPTAVPSPLQLPHPTLLVGGHSDAVLRLAAQEAGIIGFTGATWTGSGLEATGASLEAFAERIGFVRSVAGSRFSDLELNVLVQSAVVGERAADRAGEISRNFGIPLELLRSSPITLVGTVRQVTEKLVAIREDLGLSYFVVFDTAIDDMSPVVADLAGS